MMRELPRWVSIGYISGAHGIKGELKITPATDDPSRFDLLDSVNLFSPSGRPKKFEIEQVRYHSKFVLLKLKSINSRNDAEFLRGYDCKIRREDCLELPPDHYYQFELIGLEVQSVDGQYIGTVEDILEMPANDVYVVKNKTQEVLIPATKNIVKQVDLDRGVIFIELLDGLVD